MMYWLSPAWPVLLTVHFTGLETYTAFTHQPTLSYADTEAGAKWSPLFVLYGALYGGLSIHFWWHWTGQ